MATVRKIERPVCEFSSFESGASCQRQGNFEVSWSGSNGARHTAMLCYRHRWRACDIVTETEESQIIHTSHAET